jgi:hypothetical protein
MIRNYYYNQQLKKFIVGFANVFTGLKVRTGMDGCGEISELEVPIIYGSRDRVVSAIGSSNTQNKQYSLPMMACYQTGLEMDPARMKGVNQTDRRTFLEQGGVFPDDIKAVKRVMPVPYNMVMELAIHASNTDQLYQILEQVLILFDYDLQLQFNDAPFDWSRITSLFLTGINNEENYPTGIDRRMIIWTLTFTLPIWLSPPVEIRNEIIQGITLRIGDMSDFVLDEIGENGELAPFTNPWSVVPVTGVGSAGGGGTGGGTAGIVPGTVGTIGGIDYAIADSNAVLPPTHFDAAAQPCDINPLAKP